MSQYTESEEIIFDLPVFQVAHGYKRIYINNECHIEETREKEYEFIVNKNAVKAVISKKDLLVIAQLLNKANLPLVFEDVPEISTEEYNQILQESINHTISENSNFNQMVSTVIAENSNIYMPHNLINHKIAFDLNIMLEYISKIITVNRLMDDYCIMYNSQYIIICFIYLNILKRCKFVNELDSVAFVSESYINHILILAIMVTITVKITKELWVDNDYCISNKNFLLWALQLPEIKELRQLYQNNNENTPKAANLYKQVALNYENLSELRIFPEIIMYQRNIPAKTFFNRVLGINITKLNPLNNIISIEKAKNMVSTIAQPLIENNTLTYYTTSIYSIITQDLLDSLVSAYNKCQSMPELQNTNIEKLITNIKPEAME